MNTTGAPTYRIRDWNTHFENHESRKIRCLQWVPMKNKHDGSSYRRVASLKNAVEIFCAWSLIVQVASRMPARGVLRDNDGPLTANELSLKTGFPEKIFHAAFEVLSRPEIHWIEVEAGESPGSSRLVPESPGTSGKIRVEGKGREGNRREDLPPTPKGGEGGGFSYPEDFEEFWAGYPRKEGKGAAFRAWKRIKGKPPVEEMRRAVERQKSSEQWQRDGGQFIPHPSTWLNGRRWEDGGESHGAAEEPRASPGECGSVIGWMMDERARLDAQEQEDTHETEVED